jgi:hypothetical protein
MKWLTINDVMKRLGISQPDTVLRLIKSNAVKAVNISANPAGRATWRISEDSFNEFLAARTFTPAPAPARRRRRVALEPVPNYIG